MTASFFKAWTATRPAASWSKATQEASASAHIPLSYDPGKVYRFDRNHEVVLIDGVTEAV